MKAIVKVIIQVITFFGLYANSFAAYVDGVGVEYTMTKNEHGAILRNRLKGIKNILSQRKNG